jgi:hypothetical protein
MLAQMKMSLEDKKDQLKDNITHNKSGDVLKLQDLTGTCKFYSEVENHGKWGEIGFKILHK